MSIIVAVRKDGRTVMAADTLTLFGESHRVPRDNSVTAKVMAVGEALVGSAGWGVYDPIMRDFLSDRDAPDLGSETAVFAFLMELWHALHDRYSFVNDQSHNKDTPFGDLDSSFLVAHAAGIFNVSSDMDVTTFRQYYAIGSGSDYALGAMHVLYDGDLDAEAVARRAVAAAMAFDVHCDGDVTVLDLPRGVGSGRR